MRGGFPTGNFRLPKRSVCRSVCVCVRHMAKCTTCKGPTIHINCIMVTTIVIITLIGIVIHLYLHGRPSNVRSTSNLRKRCFSHQWQRDNQGRLHCCLQVIPMMTITMVLMMPMMEMSMVKVLMTTLPTPGLVVRFPVSTFVVFVEILTHISPLPSHRCNPGFQIGETK